jgi:hypothetical protein
MTQPPYGQYIITQTREYTPQELKMMKDSLRDNPLETTVKMERLLGIDNSIVPDSSMYMDCIWLWGGVTKSGRMEEPHIHDFDEIIGFISSDPDNPKDLGAVMEMNLGDEVHYLTKSCLIHIPAGLKHGPLTFKEVHRPVFFFTLAPTGSYGRTSGRKNPEALRKSAFVPPAGPDASGTKYGRYIFTEPRSHAPSKPRPEDAAVTPPPKNAKTSHIVSLDGAATAGGLYVDFVWIWNGSMTMSPQPHSHDFEELIGIISAGNPENPRAINGDVSINMGGQKQLLTRSSLIYIPKGLEHCPLEFKNILKPVLCFTIGNTTRWDIS